MISGPASGISRVTNNTATRRADDIQANFYIGSGCSVEGDLALEGAGSILGNVKGEVVVRGRLVVGESAVIDSPIRAVAAEIFGRVRGNIECSESLELHAGACVTGDISSPRVIIRDGVVFEGRCSMPKENASLSEQIERSFIRAQAAAEALALNSQSESREGVVS